MSKGDRMLENDWMMPALRPKRSQAMTRCSCARCCQDKPCDSVMIGAPCEYKACICRDGMPKELDFDR